MPDGTGRRAVVRAAGPVRATKLTHPEISFRPIQGSDCPTDRTDPELAAEQAYVTPAYARLEAMRAAAERVRTAYADVRAGGTHQARLERDIAWDVTQRRLADLDIGESPLVFGRLDLERRRPAGTSGASRSRTRSTRRSSSTGARRSPSPSTGRPRSSRWRVVRRRHLITRKGREVDRPRRRGVRPARRSKTGAAGRGRGRAARRARTQPHRPHGRHRRHDPGRTGRGDPRRRAGVLVVAGGPGTGKTAVALHRAAYLLYTHRRRLARQGVLLIGPSPVFLRYIEHVLPSLGEQDVQLSTISGLKPRLRVRGDRARRDRGAEGRRAHGARHRARGRRSRTPAARTTSSS